MTHEGSNDLPAAAHIATHPLRIALVGLVLAAMAAGAGAAHADGPTLAIDADPAGNRPTEIASITTCVSVATGDSFEVDVLIQDVEDLLAWEANLKYDPAVLQVTQRDVRVFQQANAGSSVYDLSEKVPDTDGVYRLSAADTSFPPTPDSGSGVLAELTLEAVGPGTSDLLLANEDLDGDGKPDRGIFLRDADANIIGDLDGDTLFDGDTSGAQVAVDRTCPPGSTGSEPDEGSGIRFAYVLVAVVAGATFAALGALVLLARRRVSANDISD